MNTLFKKIALCALTILPVQQMFAVETPVSIADLLKDPKVQEFVLAISKMKADQMGSISKNFMESGQGIKEGIHSLGLGVSRLVLESSQTFRDLGASLARHYWVLGGMLAGATWFY